jgi:hypothetical protein
MASLSGDANKNKLTAALESVAATINGVSSSGTLSEKEARLAALKAQPGANAAEIAALEAEIEQTKKGTELRTTMTTNLKTAVLSTGGPPIDVTQAAAALASIAAVPGQLSAETQGVLAEIVDALLNSQDAQANGVEADVARNLIGTVSNLAAAQSASSRRAAFSSGGGSNTGSYFATMRSQIEAITGASAKKMTTGGPPLDSLANGVKTSIRRTSAQMLAGSNVGIESVYDGFIAKMPSSISSVQNPGDYIAIEISSFKYTPNQVPVSSPVITVTAQAQDGTALPSAMPGNIMLNFTLSKDAYSPVCARWVPSSSSWQLLPGAYLTSFQSAGGSVSCTVDQMGTFAIRDVCNPATTCSGNGQCNMDGSCNCALGWTGSDCAQQYCDNIMFKCTEGQRCKCTAPPFDCRAECLTSMSAAYCDSHCPDREQPYSVSDCPVVAAGRQTFCVDIATQ